MFGRYALRRCDWPWYNCLGSCRLVQACFLPWIGARAVAKVNTPTSATDRYLGAWQLCARMIFLGITCQRSARQLQINLITDSDVAWDTLLRGATRQSDWNGLITGIWFRAAAQAALLLAWRVPSKLNLADEEACVRIPRAHRQRFLRQNGGGRHIRHG